MFAMMPRDRRRFCKFARSHGHRSLALETLETRQLLAVFTVNNLGDTSVTMPDEAPGTLRQAIFDANSTVGADQIVFESGLAGEIGLVAGVLVIDDSVDLIGPGADQLTVNAQGGLLAFSVESGDVAMSGITVTGGDNFYSASGIRNRGNLELADVVVRGNYGGGIGNVNGDLTLVRTVVTDNSRFDGGAGIASRGTLTVMDSVVSNNSVIGSGKGTSFNGGGIAFDGTLTLVRSTITGNSVRESGGGIAVRRAFNGPNVLSISESDISDNVAAGLGMEAGGGGIYMYGDAIIINSEISDNLAGGRGGGIFVEGDLTIEGSTFSGNVAESGGGLFARVQSSAAIHDSTFADNSAELSGGGIFMYKGASGMPSATVTNSTVSGNQAASGGGVYNRDTSLQIRNTTITDNEALPGAGSGILSGGVAADDPGATRTELASTIVAGNANSDVDFAIINTNSFFSTGFNLVGTGNGVASFTRPTDLTGILDPLLGPLANNGGTTLTHEVLRGSPAIDAGDNPLGLEFDQRGAAVRANRWLADGYWRCGTVVPGRDDRGG